MRIPNAMDSSLSSILQDMVGQHHVVLLNRQHQVINIGDLAQQSVRISRCIHPNCTICEERRKEELKRLEERKEKERLRREDYNRRVEEYKKKWREFNANKL